MPRSNRTDVCGEPGKLPLPSWLTGLGAAGGGGGGGGRLGGGDGEAS
jgi:hypothetical protein